VTDLTQFELPSGFQVKEYYGPGPADRADHVRIALERLHEACPLELVEFSSRGGLASRAIQAKRAGLCLTDVLLAVRLDGNSQRERERGNLWPSHFGEVEGDYLERFAFEEADVQCLPDPALAAFARQNGWQIQASAVNSAAGYEHALRAVTPPATASGPQPLVTVGITHYNMGRFFPDTLAALAAQSYGNLEVIAIDDGSTDAASVEGFAAMRRRYPHFRFLTQANAGVAAARNRCLAEAHGEFYVSVDADNLPRPDMIARFVAAIQRNPHLAALTCYLLGFEHVLPNGQPRDYLYAIRPTGGPHALAGIRNVYGDSNAIYRTAALRAIGGYEIDRDTSTEDWEAFIKLVHAGYRLGVIPDHLFYYRHREDSFTRTTNWFANHQRVLRQFSHVQALSPAESLTLWSALLGFHQRLEQYKHAVPPRRHQIADRLVATVRSVLGTLPKAVRSILRPATRAL
jgi:glycosyltransferase involved in cell wall biosynthesis